MVTRTRDWPRSVALALIALGSVASGRTDLEPISLDGWNGDPPSFVADEHRFELLRVVAEFTTHHGRRDRYPVGGATLRLDGWVSPPEPRAILGGRGTLEFEEILDARGVDLLAAAGKVEPRRGPLRFQKGPPGGARRLGFQVQADVYGLPEVPAAIRSLRGHVTFPVVEAVETVSIPLVIADDLVEVRPGIRMRVTEVSNQPEQVRIMIDYAIKNAEAGFDGDEPPFLLDGWLTREDGSQPPRQTWAPSVGRNVLLHTGRHSAIRMTALHSNADGPVTTATFEVITALRTVTIPFHFTELALSGRPAPPPAAQPAYAPGVVADVRVAEHGEILLSLTRLTSEHAVTLRGEAVPTARIGVDLSLELPPGYWAHARRPVITAVVDQQGRTLEIEPRPDASADRLTHYREVAPSFMRPIRLSFNGHHDRPPLTGLSSLRGHVPLRRASVVERVEVPWGAREETEILPGLLVECGAPEGDLSTLTLPVKVIRMSPLEPLGPTRLPYVVDVEILADDGSPLHTQRNLTRTDDLEDRTIERGRLIATRIPDGRTPTTTVWHVVTAAERIDVEFTFEDLPFRVRRE